MATLRFVFTVASSLCLALGCKTVSPTSNVNLVGGSPAKASDYPAVFWLSDCTATKVANNVVITAGHCVVDSDDGEIWEEFLPGGTTKYSTARVVSRNKTEPLEVVKSFVHPKYQSCLKTRNDGENCKSVPDVALLQVKPDGSFKDLPEATIDFTAVNGGDPIVMMGYGRETDELEANRQPRLKFAPTTVAFECDMHTAMSETLSPLGHDFTVFFGTLGVLVDSSNPNLGSGDSGGPVFRSGAKAGIVGINSYGFCPTSKPVCQRTTNSFFTRLDKGRGHGTGEWIESVMRGMSKTP